jgi:hypothetical protein
MIAEKASDMIKKDTAFKNRIVPNKITSRSVPPTRTKPASYFASTTTTFLGIVKVCPERGREFYVGRACGSGAVQEMKDCWPFGVALRGEASNRHMLRER